MILISACLAGVNCKYNGATNHNEKGERLVKAGKAIPICPEVLGGLSTPRNPCEIRLIQGKKSVVDENDNDFTAEFELGAKKTLGICQVLDIHRVILQERSPSCGKGKVYSGNFDGKLIAGNGLVAELLINNGISVATIDETIDIDECEVGEMGQLEAETIVNWSYPDLYKCYNMNGDYSAVAELLAGDYYSVLEEGVLIGFYCYGRSAQIPIMASKGHYDDEGYVDIGLGLHPDLCGVGNGSDFMKLGIDYGRQIKGAKAFRLSVAYFNHKAIKLYKNLGFEPISDFLRASDQQRFIIMTKKVL